MKIGTKSLLFGCHQFIIHPVSVCIAWRKIYGKFPSIGETAAIIIHDWGYLGKPNIDYEEGDKHPEWAFDFFDDLSWKCYDRNWEKLDQLFTELAYLCLYHSRFYAKSYKEKPSKLCLADKLGSILIGRYAWAFFSTLSGEFEECRNNPKYENYYTGAEHNNALEWYDGYCEYMLPKLDKYARIQKENELEKL